MEKRYKATAKAKPKDNYYFSRSFTVGKTYDVLAYRPTEGYAELVDDEDDQHELYAWLDCFDFEEIAQPVGSTKQYRTIPTSIKAILLSTNGYLVGSAAKNLAEGVQHSLDFDIIVEDRQKFQDVVKGLEVVSAGNFSVNSFGGLKFKLSDGIELDIWPESLGHYIATSNQQPTYAYTMRGNKMIKVDKL